MNQKKLKFSKNFMNMSFKIKKTESIFDQNHKTVQNPIYFNEKENIRNYAFKKDLMVVRIQKLNSLLSKEKIEKLELIKKNKKLILENKKLKKIIDNFNQNNSSEKSKKYKIPSQTKLELDNFRSEIKKYKKKLDLIEQN